MIAAAYSTPSVLVFATSALLILAGAIGVIAVKNPVHAALCLILTLIGVAVAFVAQSADFLAAVGVAITVGGLIALMAKSHWVSGATSVTTKLSAGSGNVHELGTAVFTTYLFAFEATAALLIIAVVGAVLLARRERPIQSEKEA